MGDFVGSSDYCRQLSGVYGLFFRPRYTAETLLYVNSSNISLMVYAKFQKMVALLLVLKIGMEHSMIREKVGSPK